MIPFVLIWGGGEMASGVAFRLHRVGIKILVVETYQPLAVRRTVSFAQAVYDGDVLVEDIKGTLISTLSQAQDCWEREVVPLIVDPNLTLLDDLRPLVLIDARMRKIRGTLPLEIAELIIGLGPGFIAGDNCHAAIETNRGHALGRVYWDAEPQADTGLPGKVGDYTGERVFHAQEDGEVEAFVAIGDQVNAGDLILRVGNQEMFSPFLGVVRGLIHPGLYVKMGTKVGDIDPRPETFRCWTVSEKTLAIGGGVLEAILTRSEIRRQIWSL